MSLRVTGGQIHRKAFNVASANTTLASGVRWNNSGAANQAPMSVYSNLYALNDIMPLYRKASYKTTQETMAKHGRELDLYVLLGYMDVVPSEERIMRDVRMAGWKLKVGKVAKRLAASALKQPGGGMEGGLWGKWDKSSGNGNPIYGALRTLRIGKRGNLITGGKHGKTGRAATLAEGRRFSTMTIGKTRTGRKRGKQWKGKEFGRGAHTPVTFDGSPLAKKFGTVSRREVEIFKETMLRVKGRRSLAVSWMYKRRGKSISDMVMKLGAPMAHTNPKAEEVHQGDIAYRQLAGKDGHNAVVTIRSTMPGTEKWPGVIYNAVNKTRANLMAYIIPRLNKDAWQASSSAIKNAPLKRVDQWPKSGGAK